MLIRDASFVVVDTETTGGRASSDRVIEIAGVRVRGGEVVDRFEELVNPECAVPRRITRLTGISTAMVFEKPAACDVMPRFLEFLGKDVFVAHNLTFDLRFLNHESRRLECPEIPNETLCTLRLARRLLPGLRSKGLSSLADFYGIRIRRHHRALADAEATAEILLRFFDHLDLEFGIDRLQDLLTFQHRRYGDVQQISRHIQRIREEVLSDLPEQPGVYFMKDGRGRTMYVGKAQNLNNRVRSYFTSVEGHPPRIRKLVKSVREIDWQVTDSELDALLLESRLIKDLQPPYNRAHRQYVNRPFIRIDTTHEYPRVTMSAFVHDDGAEYYGPISGRSEATFLVDVIDRFFRLRECDDETFSKHHRCAYASMGRCTAPCEAGGKTDDYVEEVDRVRAFLGGQDHSVTERIETAMRAASAELDYEKAATYRDWLARLERMLSKRGGAATRVLEHHAVVVHTPESRAARLLVIRAGLPVETVTVEPSNVSAALAELQHALERHFTADFAGPDVYREQEIDALYLLSHWLYVHRTEIRQIYWSDGQPIGDVVGEAARLLTTTAVAA